jgi:hypothetical protein
MKKKANTGKRTVPNPKPEKNVLSAARNATIAIIQYGSKSISSIIFVKIHR